MRMYKFYTGRFTLYITKYLSYPYIRLTSLHITLGNCPCLAYVHLYNCTCVACVHLYSDPAVLLWQCLYQSCKWNNISKSCSASYICCNVELPTADGVMSKVECGCEQSINISCSPGLQQQVCCFGPVTDRHRTATQTLLCILCGSCNNTTITNSDYVNGWKVTVAW